MRTSGSSLTVLPHSPGLIQQHDSSSSNKLSPMSQQPVDMFMKISGNLSPGRPPPPPYFPPPPPGSVQPVMSPTSVIQSNSYAIKHINNSSTVMANSPQNYNSATWERPIHRGGTIAGVGSSIRQGSQLSTNHHVQHNNMTSSMNKLTVPPPLGRTNLYLTISQHLSTFTDSRLTTLLKYDFKFH